MNIKGSKYLMLHDVRNISSEFYPKRYKFPYFYTIDQFEKLLDRYKPISFNEKSLEKYIYTFDDGLVDHLYVAKLLLKLRKRAIFFVPSEPVLERKMIDSHKIQFVLAAKDESIIMDQLLKIIKKEFNIKESYLTKFKNSKWKNNIWSKEMIFVTRVLREFKTYSERTILLDNLFRKFVSSDEKDFANSFYLNNDQVKEISEMDHIIGGHGHKSNDFRYCDNYEISNELNLSDKFISKFNPDQKYYAYANGGFNDYAIYLLQKLNYKMAFTTNLKNQGLSDLSNFFYKRIDPSKL